MPIAAVPEYLGQDFKEASPGMRFGMYLPIWTDRADQEKEIKDEVRKKSPDAHELRDILKNLGMDAAISHMKNRRRFPALWEKNTHAANEAWGKVAHLSRDDRNRSAALAKRQSALTQALGGADQLLILEAKSIAPFTTGLGNEHPLENGFSFLWPYGLPYLPGSGIKGVLRQAARELASGEWREDSDWRGLERPAYVIEVGSGQERRCIKLSTMDVLFGREPPKGDRDSVRGALTFWDVIPRIASNELMVEVMTGHQSHYYMKGESPHDSGQPIPVFFLTVPPGSRFTFHVFCDRPFLQRIAPDLAENDRWKNLLRQAFEHAFAWLGFGAKTAVGYGAMEEDPKAVARRRQEEEEQRRNEEERRKAEEEARRRAEEARIEAEKARCKAEALASMPAHRRVMAEAKERLVGLRRQMTIADQSGYGGLRFLVKELLAAAKEWGASERAELGEWLQQVLDGIEHGWRHPDLTPKQRKKWEKKTRDAIARLKADG